MSGAVFPSDPSIRRAAPADALASIRTVAGVAAAFTEENGATRLAKLAEYGGYRAKFPDGAEGVLEAAIINTGGGVAGGDRVQFDMSAGARASATIATATAERIYRSSGAASEIDVHLAAAPAATLAWLPQATILFSGAKLRRRFEADLAADARFILAETTIFGRIASGETMGEGLLHDVWRVRRDGRLIFAEASRLDGDIASLLARPAVADAVRGIALLLCVAPDIEDKKDAVREAVTGADALSGVSAWNGLLVVRLLASRLDALQLILRRVIGALQISPVPHVWRA
jgi:urease accessory protein